MGAALNRWHVPAVPKYNTMDPNRLKSCPILLITATVFLRAITDVMAVLVEKSYLVSNCTVSNLPATFRIFIFFLLHLFT